MLIFSYIQLSISKLLTLKLIQTISNKFLKY